MSSTIDYQVKTSDGRAWTFVVDVERTADTPARRPKKELPQWTALETHPCSSCPLAGPDHTHCPAAVDLVPVVDAFNGMASFERVEVCVTTEEREYRKSTDLQELLRSLVGLLMSTSACPLLSRFKPMGRLHLPFSTVEETLFRVVSVHLLRAFFAHKDGGEAVHDLAELSAFYAALSVVNREFCARLRTVAKGDANMNGIVQLFTLGLLVNDELDTHVGALRALVR